MAKGDRKRKPKNADAAIAAAKAAQEEAERTSAAARAMVAEGLDAALAEGGRRAAEAAAKAKRQAAALKGLETRRKNAAARAEALAAATAKEASAAAAITAAKAAAEGAGSRPKKMTRKQREAFEELEADAEYDIKLAQRAAAQAARDVLRVKYGHKLPKYYNEDNPSMNKVTVYKDDTKTHNIPAHIIGSFHGKPKRTTTAYLKKRPPHDTVGYVGKRSAFAKWFGL